MDWAVLWDYRQVLIDGLGLTVALSAVAIGGSFVLGTTLGCIGSLPGFVARRSVDTYVEAMRNVPVVAKLFFLYFVLGFDAIPAGLIALVSHQSAYIADVVASGFRTVPREQSEAAWSQGLARHEVFVWVLLPQVFRTIMPPLTSQFIEVVKNSSVIMLIGVQEMTFQTQHIEHQTFRGFEAATAVTVLYLVLALAIALAMTGLQRRFFGG
ncbi:MAG: amino acid ABC transporter permease [Alphaproteobacteria bacterium]|nr:amino acid ABC transporter permease [Alphaproteobacteria bacterium]